MTSAGPGHFATSRSRALSFSAPLRAAIRSRNRGAGRRSHRTLGSRRVFRAAGRHLLLPLGFTGPVGESAVSPRWSKAERRGLLDKPTSSSSSTAPPNVFSRAPSIKGIFMQRAKVIRSLGMHIARASHGLFLSLSPCYGPAAAAAARADRETDRESKRLETSPKRSCPLQELSVRLSVSFSFLPRTPPPPPPRIPDRRVTSPRLLSVSVTSDYFGNRPARPGTCEPDRR